ncbi:hypothetical protein PV327_004267 [Microctonus hyperodae]|uniref:Cytochrome P450 n=1 Tax=Microctonus hyperodae TaxID=165561 RepID=A0AA39KMG9_MICHY|nr:hypothetical protein PV327_004267 [Microctonus hyperodae]
MLPLSVLFSTLLLLLLYLSSLKPKGYPPGPKWWPIIGCAIEVARIRKKTKYLHKACSWLSEKYGPVIGLKIGVDQIVVLNSFESIKSMLINEKCDGRPIGPFYEARTFGKRLGVLVTDGALWLEHRRFILRHLRDFGFGKNNMAAMIEEEAMCLVDNLLKRMESSTNIKENDFIHKNNFNINNNSGNMRNDGRIYQLVSQNIKKKSNDNWDLISNIIKPENSTKCMKIEDMYMKAEDYAEVRKVAQSTQMIVQMDEVFGVPILNTLWRMMAGKRFNQDDKKLNHLQKILTTLLIDLDMIGCLFGHFPILRFIAPEMSGYKKFMETHRELWAFLNEELNEHKQTFDPSMPKDLMDAYLKILQLESYDKTFSESQLLAICVDLFVAGSETTTKALNFGFLYLVLYPEVQQKAQEEIDRVIGRNRLPTLSDRPRMPYVNAISLESLRMFMGRTLNVPHRTMTDANIMGYRIPKDTMIVANFNKVLMDESWSDPEVFRPERFIDSEGNISLPNQYIPFSIGKHRCMGEVLAKSNIFVFIATLLQAFTFSVPSIEETPTTEYTDGVTASPLPFKVLLTKRS